MKEYTPDYVKCCQFDRYCKLVLYHEAIDYLREMQRYRKYQISLEDISPAQWDKFSTRDEYPCDSFVFSAFGYAYISGMSWWPEPLSSCRSRSSKF